MSRRFFAGLGLLAAVTGGPAAGQAPPAAATTAAAPKTWTAPRTPWGHPDLQGVWANNSATPLERPKELAGKEFLSPEEVATLQARAARIFEGGGDAAFGDSIFQTALVNGEGFRSRDGQTGSYNQFWMVDRDFDNRTSLIVDPPDGRMPRLTPEAEKRRAALAAIRQRIPEGPEDRSLA